jgi:hypothetical protein
VCSKYHTHLEWKLLGIVVVHRTRVTVDLPHDAVAILFYVASNCE